MLMRGTPLTWFEHTSINELLTKWLGHADARQVYDLPDAHAPLQTVSDRQPAVGDRLMIWVLDGKSKITAHQHGQAMYKGVSCFRVVSNFARQQSAAASA